MRTARTLRVISAALYIVAAGVSSTQAAVAAHWTKIDTNFGFQGWRQQLQRMVDQDGRFALSHFCIVVATGPTASPANKFTWAYVHWREAAQLYTFGQSDEPMSDLTVFKGPLDLRKDVVATERDVKGSTSRVTRAWVQNVDRHCASAGTQVVVRAISGAIAPFYV